MVNFDKFNAHEHQDYRSKKEVREESTEKLWEEKMQKVKRTQSAECLFSERAKWKQNLRYDEATDPKFRRFADPNDPWTGRKPTTF